MADEQESFLDPSVWESKPRPDSNHIEVVYDEDLGSVAELTTPDGERFYGTDTPSPWYQSVPWQLPQGTPRDD